LPNTFGGYRNTPLSVAIFKLLDWQQFVGPFGKRVIFFPKNPVELIYHAVVFMKYWAGSHVADDALQPNQGVDALLELAAGTATRRTNSAGASNTPRLMDRPADDMEVDGEDDEDADNLAE
jgi:hypothetical protein